MKSTTVAQADNQICHQLGSWTNLLVETLVSRMEENDALLLKNNATLALGSLALFADASAEPKDEVAAATSTWARALGEDDPDKVLPLYADDAVLWGTLSPTVRSDRSTVRDYFVAAFKVLPGLKVAFGDQLIRVYDCGTAVNTGYYTFSYVKDGETKSLPARYSFTYVKRGDAWLIVDHHSSAIPPVAK